MARRRSTGSAGTWSTARTSWGHAGAFSVGARTLVTLYPHANVGLLVLTNAFPSGAPEGLSASFFDVVFSGEVSRDWFEPWDAAYSGMFAPAVAAAEAAYARPPDPATPALPLAAYVGTYSNAYVGDAVVSEQNGGLLVSVGPGGARHYPLTHFDRDTFLYSPDPELPDLPSSARFLVGPDGRAASVTLQSLDDNGMGTLGRAD